MPNLNERNPLTNWPGQTDSAIDPSTGLPHGTWSENELFRDLINFEDRAIPGTILIELNDDFIIDDRITVAGEIITFYATDADLAAANGGLGDTYGVSLESSTTATLQATAISGMTFAGFTATNEADGIVLFAEEIAGTQTIEEAIVTGTGTLLTNTATAASGYEDPLAFFLLASDILVLRDSVFSLQETLGINPGQSSLDVSITNLTDRLLYIEGGDAFDSRYDARYGGIPQVLTYGATWAAIYDTNPAQRSKLTILGHKHDGILNSKINLTTDVNGLLLSSNFDYNSITGSTIWSNSAKTETIAEALINSLNLTSITEQVAVGPIQINNNFGTLLIKDLEVKNNILSGYSASSDTSAWSGSSFIATTAIANGVFYRKVLTKTKYWRYSIGLRSSVSNVSVTGMIAKLIVRNNTTGSILKTFNIYPTLYNTTNYEIIYTDFIFNGTRPQDSIRIDLEWVGNGKGVTWKADSISIVPVHLSVYDI